MRKTVLRRAGVLLLAAVLLVLSGCNSVRKVKLDDEQKHLVAYGAIMGERMEMNNTDLAGIYGAARSAIEDDMRMGGVITRYDALNWLDELKGGPNHAAELGYGMNFTGDNMLHMMQGKLVTVGNLGPDDIEMMRELYYEHCDNVTRRTELSRAALDRVDTLAAYDCEMLIAFSRLFFGLEFIDEDEAWEYIEYAVQYARDCYDSWEDYAAAYLVACIFEDDASDSYAAVNTLLGGENGPYQMYAFGG